MNSRQKQLAKDCSTTNPVVMRILGAIFMLCASVLGVAYFAEDGEVRDWFMSEGAGDEFGDD